MAKHRGSHRSDRKHGGSRHRSRKQAPEVATWLGAGAITLGMGAAMASGTGVAGADTGEGSSSVSSSSSSAGNSPSNSDAGSTAQGGTPGGRDDASHRVNATFQPSGSSSNETPEKESRTRAPLSDDRKAASSTDGRSLAVESTESRIGKKRSAVQTLENSGVDVAPQVASTMRASDQNISPALEVSSAPAERPVAPGAERIGEASPEPPPPLALQHFTVPVPMLRETDVARITSGASFESVGDPPLATMTAIVAAVTAATPTPPGYTEAEWQAYLKRFTDVDPEGIYLTPATSDWTESRPTQNFTEQTYRDTIAQTILIVGHQGFAQTSSGLLQYTNTHASEVAILYAPHPPFNVDTVLYPAGIVRVNPGQTVVLSEQAKVAQVLMAGSGGPETNTFVGTAALGYPPFDVPVTNSPPNTVVQWVKNIAKAVSTFVAAVDTWFKNLRAELEWSLKPSAPWDAGRLYETLSNKTATDADKIYIEKVQLRRGGEERLVVYIGGTVINHPDQGFWENLPSYAGTLKGHQIDAIINALGTSEPDTEIMLVGYSQGGLDAQNIAANSTRLGLKVTTVVTYGSPITTYFGSNLNVVHFADPFDPIPDLGKRDETDDNARNGNIFERRAASTTAWNLFWDPTGMNVHGRQQTYVDIGLQFEWTSDGRFYGVRDAMRKFEGKVSRVYG